MLSFFKTLSLQRKYWLLLLISTLALEATALYFQHGMGLKPCVMCIYERVALFGIAFAAIFGSLAPGLLIMRLIALVIGLGSAIKGLTITLTHLDYQTNPAPWKQCSFFAEFPETLPLDKWLPAVFNPTGNCAEISWQFLGFTMVQWLVFIFAFYVVLLALLLISQVKRSRPSQRNLFR
ncbi:thiol:disulfide interchange protein DsbB [Cricetibacter osteomyelitidis]|uniref:Disulfide bond formation protein B n=1 Tax=Cricetibacter osteomyelitidis TaxID=1521931 RepID=A0A4R2T5K4_9PAST|nr:disulfide bond formation protein DsbB [Cricetibacter osteomyelitidis]TCP96831.1 thiol:disulfide interchange protein DsbB [Cricetibacter osteomyelitidis]